MKILLIGAFPPPIGGITVHIKRLFDSLRDKGHQVEVYDFGGKSSPQKPAEVYSTYQKILLRLLNYNRKKHPETILHIHVSAMGKFRWIGPILITIFRNYPKVITIHSGSFIKNIEKGANPAYVRWLLERFDQIITVNQEMREFLINRGIDGDQITVIPAFIPGDTDPTLLPAGVQKLRSEKEVLVLTSGYLTPLYNYEDLIFNVQRLPKDKYGFIFAFYHQYDPEYQDRINPLLEVHGNVVIFKDLAPDVFSSLMSSCDIYVRSTLKDGDSVAVREALHKGKIVYATDVVQRPPDCQLYPVQNSEALLALFNQEFYSSTENTRKEVEAGIDPILDVYSNASAQFHSKR